jgi:hypothetical protein
VTKIEGSIGLIRHPKEVERLWLAVWDQQSAHFDFVFAERLENDSFRECLDREIAWTLPLRKGKDYLISSVARLHLDTAFSVAEQTNLMLYSIELFIVDLFGKMAAKSLANDPDMLWVSSEEVLGGQTNCGRKISPRLVSLIRKADVFPPKLES